MKGLMKKIFLAKKVFCIVLIVLDVLVNLLPFRASDSFMITGVLMLIPAVVLVNGCSEKDMLNEEGMPIGPRDPARARFALFILMLGDGRIFKRVTAAFIVAGCFALSSVSWNGSAPDTVRGGFLIWTLAGAAAFGLSCSIAVMKASRRNE